jgi:hypothetical protein
MNYQELMREFIYRAIRVVELYRVFETVVERDEVDDDRDSGRSSLCCLNDDLDW